MLKKKKPDVSKLVINIVLNPIIGETKIKIPGVSKLVTSTPLITKIAEVEDKTVGQLFILLEIQKLKQLKRKFLITMRIFFTIEFNKLQHKILLQD